MENPNEYWTGEDDDGSFSRLMLPGLAWIAVVTYWFWWGGL